jgi:outer membrane autotransporter protein
MTGDSTAAALNMGSNGKISYQTDLSSGSYGTLTVGNLSGTGLFDMRASVVNQQGDLLKVTGMTAGNHTLNVQNDGRLPANGTEEITLVETADGGGTFGLKNQVELGGWTYDLKKVGNNWQLMSTGESSSAASAAINLFSDSYLISYVENQTLMQRMGDQRQGAERNGVWARVYCGNFESDGDSFIRGYDMDYSGIQVGGDRKFVLKDGKGDFYLGGMFSYTQGDLDYGRSGDGSIDSKALGIYGTYVAPNGFYTDLVFKYSWMDNDFKALDSAWERITGDNIETGGFSASLEVGKRFFLQKAKEKQGWYVEPQAQISFGSQSGDSFTASNGLRIRVDDYNSVLGRLGANIGYEIKSGKNPINVYGKVSYVHEFDGDVNYRLNDAKLSTDFGDHWWTYGVGITAKLGTRHNVYFDLERATGDQVDQSWGLNGGYRYSW